MTRPRSSPSTPARRSRTARALLPATLTTVLAAAPATPQVTLQQEIAEAGVARESFLERKPGAREFRFRGGKAVLRADGTWRHEALIRHSGLRCGTYRLGIRFGTGRPGCLDVTWVSAVALAAPLKHCNNAERLHFGEGYQPRLEQRFEAINCAEQSAQCEGRCNASLSPPSEDRPYRFGDDSLR